MSDVFSVTVDRDKLDKVIRLGQNLGPALGPSVERVSDLYASEIQRRIPRRSGKLRKAFSELGGDARTTKDTAVVERRSRTPYEGTILGDRSTTIRAKGKRLRVPLAAALTASGIERPTPRGLVGIQSRAGNVLLVQFESRRGGKRDFVPWFALKDKVTIRGQGIAKAAARVTDRKAGDMVDDDLQRAFDRET